jgi:hypothetical protein
LCAKDGKRFARTGGCGFACHTKAAAKDHAFTRVPER